MALASYLNRKMTGSASVGLKLQCITIATFSSLCITWVVTTFNNDDNADVLKAGVIKRPVKLYARFTFLNVFFSKSKKHDFLRCLVVAHVFFERCVWIIKSHLKSSNTVRWCCERKGQKCCRQGMNVKTVEATTLHGMVRPNSRSSQSWLSDGLDNQEQALLMQSRDRRHVQ